MTENTEEFTDAQRHTPGFEDDHPTPGGETSPPEEAIENEGKPEEAAGYGDEIEELKKANDLALGEARKAQEENALLMNRLSAMEKRELQANASDIDLQASDLKTRMTRAIEDGDAEAQVEYQDKLFQLRSPPQQEMTPVSELTPQPATRKESQPPNPYAEMWVEENDWFNNPKAAAKRKEAIRIEAELVIEGYSKAPLYRRLNERLKESSAKRSQGGFGPSSRPNDEGRPAGSPKNKIDNDAKTSMRTYGFNPNNPKHVDAWKAQNDPLEVY